eukprot:TRINITY_DN31949_c0_g1_i1.p1 TRINITY_DN31949_c0_g1~~TRINITY_DN31949_c0_g1_i1.p1  ORF type:complete len:612 (-),score=25.19 TRINITY_DN31949_c0_g1_i1:629-2464(-)
MFQRETTLASNRTSSIDDDPSQRELCVPHAGRELRGATASSLGSASSSVYYLKCLPSSVRPEMIRGVPICELLSGCGRHLKSIAASATDYQLSECREKIDDFISHDWKTGRVSKMITLFYVYNRYPACIASCLVALPMGYVGSCLHVPLAKFVCPVVWATFFAFWQRMRKLLVKPRYAFLDKLCIHQTDEELKAEGILGLAGFLRTSDRMLVLWSPRYFSRLWCTYELAAWCHLHGTSCSNLFIFPVPSATVQLVFTIMLSLQDMITPICDSLGFHGTLAPILVMLILTPVLCHLALVTADMAKLPKQLQQYEIRKAKCFCCTHNHIHPETKQDIPCDRELVYGTLQKWTSTELYGNSLRKDDLIPSLSKTDSIASVDSALDDYDAIVRCSLLGVISRRMNRKLVVSTYTEWVSNAVPVCWACIDYCSPLWHAGDYHELVRWLFEFSSVAFFVLPLGMFLTVQLTMYVSQFAETTASTYARSLCVIMIVIACLSIHWGFWLSGLLLHKLGLPDGVSDAIMVLRFVCLGLATKCLLLDGRDQGTETPCRNSIHNVSKEGEVGGGSASFASLDSMECGDVSQAPVSLRRDIEDRHEATDEAVHSSCKIETHDV